jgi:membrane protein implicated in regulation of membrane protease activity
MRKERTLLILGVLVAIIPFSGFPMLWRSIFFVIIGGALIYLAYLFYMEAKARISKDNRSKAFVDNIGSGE